MTERSSPDNNSAAKVRELLAIFLSEPHEDVAADFENLCSQYPEANDELRRNYSIASKETFAFFTRRTGDREPEYSGGMRVGERIGDFTLLARIASGGQGEVWEARQASLQRRVALKLVLPDRIDKRSLALFAREARAGGRLAHAGIVAVYGYGEDGGRHWIAQELVEGSWTLRDFIDEMRNADELPPNYYRSVATFLVALADALQAAHDAGVIHRDVKPQNVLITKDDRPKLTDFGLARITDEMAVSITGDFAGTWLYMSPEQVTAKRIEIDHRTDIFSLGVVMYEMLGLVRPFTGDTTHQIAEKIIYWEPVDLTKLRSKLPHDLAVICGKALEKRKDARYPTMQEFAGDLSRWLNNEPIHATPPTQLDRFAKWCKRNPTKSVAGVLASSALVIISGLSVYIQAQNANLKAGTTDLRASADRETELRILASEREKQAQANAELAEYNAYVANVQMAGVNFDRGEWNAGRRRLNACAERFKDTWEWGWLNARQDTSLAVLEGHDDELTSCVFSPDESQVLTTSFDGTARIWDSGTGDVISVLRSSTGEIETAQFSPDGYRILTSDWDGSIRIWNARTGQFVVKLSDPVESLFAVKFSPDGDRVVSVSEYGIVCAWNAATGELISTLGQLSGMKPKVEFAPDSRHLLTIASDNYARVWDSNNGEQRFVFAEDGDRVVSASYSGDGAFILSRSNAQVVRIWDAATGQSVFSLDGDIRQASFTPDGSQILTIGSSSTFELRDSRTGLVQVQFTPQVSNAPESDPEEAMFRSLFYQFRSVEFSPDGSHLVSTTFSGALEIWDRTSGESVAVYDTCAQFDLEPYSVNSVQLSADRDRVLFLTSDDELFIWDTSTGLKFGEFRGHRGGIGSAIFSRDGSRVLSRSSDRTARIWKTPGPQEFHQSQETAGERPLFPSLWRGSATFNSTGSHILRAFAFRRALVQDSFDRSITTTVLLDPSVSISRAQFSPDDNLVATTGYSSNVDSVAARGRLNSAHLWDAMTGERLCDISGHSGDIESIAFSPDSQWVVTASEDHTARIWSAGTGELRTVLKGHATVVSDAVFSPDGRRVLTSSNDETAKLWPVEGDEEPILLEGHSDSVLRSRFDATGTRVITVSSDKTARIWNSATGELLSILEGHTASVTDGVFDLESRLALTASTDGTARVWNAMTGELERILEGHRASVKAVSFSPDGSRVLTVSHDYSARVWNPETGECMAILGGDSPYVVSACFSRDGTRILCATADGGVQVWDSVPIRERLKDYVPLTASIERMKPIVDRLLKIESDVLGVRRRLIADSSIPEIDRQAGLAVVADLQFHVDHFVNDKFDDQVFLEDVERVIRDSPNLSDSFRLLALRSARARGEPTAGELVGILNSNFYSPLRKYAEDEGHEWAFFGNDYDDAFGLTIARKAVELEPDGIGSNQALAWAHFYNGNHDEALASIQRAVDLAGTAGPGDDDVLSALAEIQSAIDELSFSESEH